MAAAPPQPGSIEFLHHFVQKCTATGQVSLLKGPSTGVKTESELNYVQRVPIMFRYVLPQNNESRHALLLVRPEVTCFQRDNMINKAFSINNQIDGTCSKIKDYRPVWADGHTPAAADVDTFNKTLRVMGCQNKVLSLVSAMTSARVGYITKFVCGTRHAPGELWDRIIHAINIPLILPYLNLDMGERMNGIMEVEAVQLKRDHCDETDRDKLKGFPVIEKGIRPLCLRCCLERYELDLDWDSKDRY